MRWFFEFFFGNLWPFVGMCLFLGGCGNFVLYLIRAIQGRGGCSCEDDDDRAASAGRSK